MSARGTSGRLFVIEFRCGSSEKWTCDKVCESRTLVGARKELAAIRNDVVLGRYHKRAHMAFRLATYDRGKP